jgi:capsular polysaccharide export protein
VDVLPAFLGERYERWGVTDQVLFGDRRPVHRAAVELARARGIRTHVFEEGYFRPSWITLEREGVNAYSRLPRDTRWYLDMGTRVPDAGPGAAFASPFWVRAAHDVAYHAASAWNPVLYPRYKTHAQCNAVVEYAGYIRRFAGLSRARQRDAEVVEGLVVGRTPFFVLPLQLNSDAQIRDHSPFEDMASVMQVVVESFARHAPPASRLVVKNHPLDMGFLDYPRILERLAARFHVEGRIDYLESGDTERLLRHASGVVTVNSTVGAQALGAGCPVVALADPIYRLPGLTFEGSLDDFWTAPTRPDAGLFRSFRNVVIHATQVNGGFYSRPGIDLGVGNAVQRLEAPRSPLEELL